MPLRKAKSKKKEDINKAVAYNIRELTVNGTKERKHDQVVAIAIKAATGRNKKKNK
jgi:hypothetical protein